MGNTLYFGADDGVHGVELWKSDGTTSGTVMESLQRKFYWISGRTHSQKQHPLFQARNGTIDNHGNYIDDGEGYELWKSDGTDGWHSDGQEHQPLQCQLRHQQACSSNATYLTPIGNTLYFSADDGVHGQELWKSDGTSSGTVMVKDINSNGDGFHLYNRLMALDNNTYFFADDGTNGLELWRTDGTTSGTVMVENIGPGSASGINGGRNLGTMGNALYFVADDGTNGRELWTLNSGGGSYTLPLRMRTTRCLLERSTPAPFLATDH